MNDQLTALYEAREALRQADAKIERIRAERGEQYVNPRGLEVKVVKGRKIPVGTTFVVQQAGEGAYGRWVRTPNGDFVNRWNVEIIDPAYLEDKQLADAEALVDERQQAVKAIEHDILAAAGVDLRCRDDVVHKSYGWREDVEFSTPCNPDAPDEIVKAALSILDPQGSSWGSLRWSCGTSLVNRPSHGLVRVSSSTGLAD